MLLKFFTFALVFLFLSGCATTNRNALELQRCHDELREKGQEIAQLERDLRRQETGSYGRSGSSGLSTPSTSQIQKALKNAGYYKGSIDGKIGAKTQEAIMKFQKDNGLKADGKVGQMTWAELKSYLD